ERATCATELTLEANAGNYNYYWYRNNQFIGAENTPRLTVERTELERENYTVLILNSRECSRSAPFRPRPPDEVAITETTNKISCQGANDGGFSINFPDSLDYLRFVWEDAMGNRVGEGTTVSDLGPGDYTLLAIDPGGCALPFTYRLREPDSLRAAAISIDANCTQNTGLGELRLSATGGTWPFQYRVAGQSYFDEDTLQLEPGNYLVEVWDINNCPSQAQEVNIGGYEPFHIEITPSSGAPELGDVLQLRLGSDRPTGNLDIRWSSDNPELNFNPLPSSPRRPPGIELSPLQAHTYRVFVRDPLDGCQRIDSLYIPVVTKRKIYLPTVFSPNGDGINDSFGPLTGSGVVTISNFAIFDRWGREVFNSPSGASWSGEDMPSGTYAYYFIASFLDGSEKRYRGSIVLLR
ncbi:MAG: gliding motility-associated C-terminal domain-containing protein, partial [Bacteroidota bacterium]